MLIKIKTDFIMSEFWNKKFKTKEYIYGEEPNEFLKSFLDKISPGKALFPAEGEGRNAVYAASRGWETFAFDTSSEGKRKALELANKKNVKIDYKISEIEEYKVEKSFDLIALIYAHQFTGKREKKHKSLLKLLKPGGIILLEGFSKKQINKHSGGPKNSEMLFSEYEIQKDFSSIDVLHLEEKELILNEGNYHKGKASVVRFLGKIPIKT